MRSLRLGAAALAVLSAASCAEPTPYAPLDGGRGYAEERLEPGRFRVSFAGNSVTPRDTVERYLLARAAEVTLAEGGAWFRIVSRDVERDVRYIVDPGPRFGLGIGSGGRFGYGASFGTVVGDGSSSYEAVAEILVGEGARPDDDPAVYDARAVLAEIGGRIERG